MRDIKKIVLHCSASAWADVLVIDSWHRSRKRPFRCFGYHFLISNGCSHSSEYSWELDGEIATGRPEREHGAHVLRHNIDSIGICMVGIDKFTMNQFSAMHSLVLSLLGKYNLTVSDVYMHYELQSNKTCPNMDGDIIRAWLRNCSKSISKYEKE